MKRIVILLVFSLLTFPLMAQKNVLVLEKAAHTKSYKYFEGDKIELVTTDSLEIKGLITAIKDSSFILDFYTEINVTKVKTVLRTRWVISIISKVLMIGGAGLVVIEAVNGAISNNGKISDKNLYIGAGAAAAGALMIPFQKAKYHIREGEWRFKSLPAAKEFEYQKNKTIRF